MDEAIRIAREARAAKDRNAVSFGKYAWRRRNLKTFADGQKSAEENVRRKRAEMAEREKQMTDADRPNRRARPPHQTPPLKPTRTRPPLNGG
jgi:hypothetical protein